MSKTLKQLRKERKERKVGTAITADKHYTEAQMTTILDSLESVRRKRADMYFYIMICVYTGARRTEAALIETKDVTKTGVTIRSLKKSRDRDIPLPPDFHAELTEYSKDKDYLFDFCPDVAARWMRKVIPPRLEIKRPLHALRHTIAVKIYRETKDIKFLQKFLGHRWISSTSVYLDAVEIEDYDLSNVWSKAS